MNHCRQPIAAALVAAAAFLTLATAAVAAAPADPRVCSYGPPAQCARDAARGWLRITVAQKVGQHGMYQGSTACVRTAKPWPWLFRCTFSGQYTGAATVTWTTTFRPVVKITRISP